MSTEIDSKLLLRFVPELPQDVAISFAHTTLKVDPTGDLALRIFCYAGIPAPVARSLCSDPPFQSLSSYFFVGTKKKPVDWKTLPCAFFQKALARIPDTSEDALKQWAAYFKIKVTQLDTFLAACANEKSAAERQTFQNQAFDTSEVDPKAGLSLEKLANMTFTQVTASLVADICILAKQLITDADDQSKFSKVIGTLFDFSDLSWETVTQKIPKSYTLLEITARNPVLYVETARQLVLKYQKEKANWHASLEALGIDKKYFPVIEKLKRSQQNAFQEVKFQDASGAEEVFSVAQVYASWNPLAIKYGDAFKQTNLPKLSFEVAEVALLKEIEPNEQAAEALKEQSVIAVAEVSKEELLDDLYRVMSRGAESVRNLWMFFLEMDEPELSPATCWMLLNSSWYMTMKAHFPEKPWDKVEAVLPVLDRKDYEQDQMPASLRECRDPYQYKKNEQIRQRKGAPPQKPSNQGQPKNGKPKKDKPQQESK